MIVMVVCQPASPECTLVCEVIHCAAAHLQDVRHFPDGEERLVSHAPVRGWLNQQNVFN